MQYLMQGVSQCFGIKGQQGQLLTLVWQEGVALLYIPNFQADGLKVDYFLFFFAVNFPAWLWITV